MKITIEVIDHHDQRYDTVGDWVLNPEKEELQIWVSNLGNWKYNFMIGFHEMVEAMLCFDRNISTEEVDKFDMDYEKKRDVGDTSEPGDDPDAPYYDEHFFATSLERLLCRELGMYWNDYEQKVNDLEY